MIFSGLLQILNDALLLLTFRILSYNNKYLQRRCSILRRRCRENAIRIRISGGIVRGGYEIGGTCLGDTCPRGRKSGGTNVLPSQNKPLRPCTCDVWVLIFHGWRTVACISGSRLVKVSGWLRWLCQENDRGELITCTQKDISKFWLY